MNPLLRLTTYLLPSGNRNQTTRRLRPGELGASIWRVRSINMKRHRRVQASTINIALSLQDSTKWSKRDALLGRRPGRPLSSIVLNKPSLRVHPLFGTRARCHSLTRARTLYKTHSLKNAFDREPVPTHYSVCHSARQAWLRGATDNTCQAWLRGCYMSTFPQLHAVTNCSSSSARCSSSSSLDLKPTLWQCSKHRA